MSMDEAKINNLGRLLTTILRHRATEMGLTMKADGYIPVREILSLKQRTRSKIQLKSHTVADVVSAVQQDSKQRMSVRGEGHNMEIRANQGHSLDAIRDDALLRPVLSPDDLPVPGLCVHGTYYEALDKIMDTSGSNTGGLKTMGRKHVHFSTQPFRSNKTISGMRKTCQVLIYLDVEKALREGIKIYLSSNEVALVSETIHPRFFLKVCRASDGEILEM